MRLSMAIDPRFDGTLVTCADVNRIGPYFEQQLAVWDEALGYTSWETIRLEVPTSHWDAYESTFDIAGWSNDVLVDQMIVEGTGVVDFLSQLGAPSVYDATLNDPHAYLYVPDWGHSPGAIDFFAALRGLVDHRLSGAPYPQIEASWFPREHEVVATLTDGIPLEVELWCSTEVGDPNPTVVPIDPQTCQVVPPIPTDSSDMRHAHWEQVGLLEEQPDGTWRADVPEIDLTYAACLVRLRTVDDRVVTTRPLLNESLCEASLLEFTR
jgi:hypothetical protein